MARLVVPSLLVCGLLGSSVLFYRNPLTQAQPAVQQGNTIVVNGKPFKVAWQQWESSDGTHLGISDPGVEQALGIESLNNPSPDLQPVQWFAWKKELKASFNNPYRYLDITELIKNIDLQTKTSGDSLILDVPVVKIEQIRQTNQDWGEQIVLDLDHPTAWQVNQNLGQATINLAGLPTAEVLKSYSTPPNINRVEDAPLRDDVGVDGKKPNLVKTSLSLEVTGNSTQIKLNIPPGYRMRVTGLGTPDRLVIDLRPDAMVAKTIKWLPGVTLHQDYINLSPGQIFPVTYLEIDPKISSLKLRPMVSGFNSLIGISRLGQMAQSQQAIAAVNGGFFNRDTQEPLGAIKTNNRWLSSPILNRGAIAWDEQGNFTVGRLTLKETLSNNTGVSLPILSLNSGYVQAGLARYTADWSTTYTPLTDNETVFVVENEQITEQISTNPTKTEIMIPKNGYLLVQRAGNPLDLEKNSSVKVTSQTIPESFANYSDILGAGPLLLEKGKMVLDAAGEHFNRAFQEQSASRSGIAISSRQNILLVTVHNRLQGNGPNLTEFAQLMQRLGAVDALNLDGGSSTSLYLGGEVIDRPPSTTARVHNGLGLFWR